MRVLVSGSSGLIGRALVRRLEEAGHTVVRLVRPRSKAPDGRAVMWEPLEGSIDVERLRDLGPYDGVVHLAGAGIGDRRWSSARRRQVRDSRVLGTERLAVALAELEPRPAVLVSASAVGYYGDGGDEVMTEDSPNGRGFLAELCRSWEEATAPALQAGIRVVRLRSGVVLAASGGALGRLLPIFRLGLGGKLGSGRQWVSWIALDDEVRVIERALDDASLRGVLNSTAPHPVTNAGLTHALAQALHRPALLAVPAPALALVLGPEMSRELLLSGQRAVPARLEAIGHRFVHPELSGALGSLLEASRRGTGDH